MNKNTNNVTHIIYILNKQKHLKNLKLCYQFLGKLFRVLSVGKEDM